MQYNAILYHTVHAVLSVCSIALSLTILIIYFALFPSDPYEYLWQTKDVGGEKCSNNCDQVAKCACGLVYGDYKCACPKGYAGSGRAGQCAGKF